MRCFLPLLLALALSACNTGGPGFSRIAAERVTQSGSTFLFRRNGPLIEAQRVSPEMLPRFQPVARKAGIAAQARTGCPVRWIVGDQAMMIMALDCPGGPKPPKIPRSRYWSCEAIGYARPVGERLVSADVNLTCRRR
ncbi:hypothetical protein FIU97_00940 [Roseivivax sp. THAF40]|uniref:hypothetical protein n=1 Tax=unclassified Roseivivax TaxID=2639302 RepID=UPI0012693982|nr:MULTISPECIES: hypothetical protein [unclassified Roseivivax]QFS81397.1 hypothetical protein FIV09_01025 [Roseivivax sp. THAF197b]QFT45126.1 hypothetical protein FIU97_00940 [Roseivivax sp. THAF40]